MRHLVFGGAAVVLLGLPLLEYGTCQAADSWNVSWQLTEIEIVPRSILYVIQSTV